MVGVARPSTVPLMPTPVASPSDQPSAGLWQLAQETVPLPDRRGSKNNALPSSTRDTSGLLSSGATGSPSSQTRSAEVGAGTFSPAVATPQMATKESTAIAARCCCFIGTSSLNRMGATKRASAPTGQFAGAFLNTGGGVGCWNRGETWRQLRARTHGRIPTSYSGYLENIRMTINRGSVDAIERRRGGEQKLWAPHPAHPRRDVASSGWLPDTVSCTLRRQWPRAQVEVRVELTWNEPRAVCIHVPVAVRGLLVYVETLWHDKLQVILGARHRHVKQAPFFLNLGGRTGGEIRRDAAVDRIQQVHGGPFLPFGGMNGRERQIFLIAQRVACFVAGCARRVECQLGKKTLTRSVCGGDVFQRSQVGASHRCIVVTLQQQWFVPVPHDREVCRPWCVTLPQPVHEPCQGFPLRARRRCRLIERCNGVFCRRH